MFDVYQCQECGSPLVNVTTGAVCPNGHGRIIAKLPADVARRNHARVLGIRDAQRLPNGNYKFYGDDREYVRPATERPLTSVLSKLPRVGDGEALAIIDGNKIYKLREVREAAAAI